MSDRSWYYVLGPGHILVPATAQEWARFMESDERIVAQEEIAPGIGISTICLGLNHRMFGDGPPLVFETMVFREGEPAEYLRWTTWDEAMEGHRLMAEAMRLLIAKT